jgi:hypothetical protein
LQTKEPIDFSEEEVDLSALKKLRK